MQVRKDLIELALRRPKLELSIHCLKVLLQILYTPCQWVCALQAAYTVLQFCATTTIPGDYSALTPTWPTRLFCTILLMEAQPTTAQCCLLHQLFMPGTHACLFHKCCSGGFAFNPACLLSDTHRSSQCVHCKVSRVAVAPWGASNSVARTWQSFCTMSARARASPALVGLLSSLFFLRSTMPVACCCTWLSSSPCSVIYHHVALSVPDATGYNARRGCKHAITCWTGQLLIDSIQCTKSSCNLLWGFIAWH